MKHIITYFAFAVFAVAGLGSAYAQNDEGLELYLSFDNDDANDESGNGRDGVVIGAPELIDSPNSRAWRFNGSLVVELRDAIFKAPDPELSIRFHMRPENTNGERIIFDEGGAWTGFTVRIMDGALQFATVCCDANHPPPVIVETDAPEDDKWHEIAAVFGKGRMVLYVDGEAASASDTDWAELGNHGQDAAIGQKSSGDTAFGGGNGFYVGALDEFRLYSRILEPDELSLSVSPKDRLTTTWAAIRSEAG